MISFKKILQNASGFSVLKQQWANSRADWAQFRAQAQDVRQALKSSAQYVDTWDAIMRQHGITGQALKQQYARRRGATICIGLAFLGALISTTLTAHVWMSLAVSLVFAVLYFSHALRLYQIRERSLCTARVYLSVCCHRLHELLPCALPPQWTPWASEVTA